VRSSTKEVSLQKVAQRFVRVALAAGAVLFAIVATEALGRSLQPDLTWPTRGSLLAGCLCAAYLSYWCWGNEVLIAATSRLSYRRWYRPRLTLPRRWRPISIAAIVLTIGGIILLFSLSEDMETVARLFIALIGAAIFDLGVTLLTPALNIENKQ
jgi:hypothetical protein